MILTGQAPICHAPTPPVQVPASPHGNAESFAALLGQSQAAVPAAQPEPGPDAPSSDTLADSTHALKPRNGNKPVTRTSAPRAHGIAQEATPHETDAVAKAEVAGDAKNTPSADGTTVPTWLMAGLAPTLPAAATVAPALAADGARAGATATDASASAEAAQNPATALAARQAEGDAARAGLKADARADTSFASRLTEMLDAGRADGAEKVGESRHASESAVAPAGTASATNLAPASAPPATPARDAGDVVAVNLPTPTASPEFAQALGVQVSLLARDGVQHAELHLNPAETGPVSVQIVLDGTQARVDFGADLAATRDAIQAGLPELAAALRDAGFTLAGGGVSQHASDPGGSAQGGREDARGGMSWRRVDGRGGPDRGEPSARVLRLPSRAGGVDLYA